MPQEEVKTGVDQSAVPPAVEVDVTKIVAQRVKEKTEKLKAEMAKAHGYDSYDELLNSGINKKLLDNGIDPDAVKPVFEEVLSTHPAVIRANEIIAEQEKTKKIGELSAFNAKFNTAFESLDELPVETKSLIEKGVTLEQAYVATHYEQLAKGIPQVDPVKLAQAQQQQSTNHIKTVPGNGIPPVNDVVVTQEMISAIQKQMPHMTVEQIKAFYAKHPNLLK